MLLGEPLDAKYAKAILKEMEKVAICIKLMIFVLKMMNSALKLMMFSLEMMNSALNIMNLMQTSRQTSSPQAGRVIYRYRALRSG